RHGEKQNARYTALAMDCSTQAAENHLRAAEQSLQVIAAANYQPLIKQLIDAYLHLTPEEDQLLPTVNNVVFRQVRLRKLLRRIITLLGLASLAAMIWGGWKLYHFART